ncbi:MAG: Zn-ribbon domain-containing OB-fold protein [bacterium]
MAKSPEEEGMVYHGRINVPYTWYVGECGSRFFTEIRDNKRIMGTKCPTCNVVYVPPRLRCGKCFTAAEKWVELGATGTLQTFTIVHYTESVIHKMEAPFAFGLIKLDGADTGLLHLLGEVELKNIKTGMRVEAVFAEERKGNILDIKYFKPV